MSKILDTLLAEDISDKIIKGPQRAKQLGIAYRHDRTFPLKAQARLGPKPTDADVAKMWGPMLDQTLANTQYGDLSRDFKFADWLTKLYTGGGDRGCHRTARHCYPHMVPVVYPAPCTGSRKREPWSGVWSAVMEVRASATALAQGWA